ncbi:4Fe-4S binding protein, partial [Salinispira pacifica]
MRQSIRKLVFTLSFLLFPVTIYYFSPIVVLFGLSRGTAAGSLVVFGLLLVGGAVFGRLFCSWVCPAGFVQELAGAVTRRRYRGPRWIKYLVWAPWVVSGSLLMARAGGIHAIDFTLGTSGGISISEPRDFVVYFAVVGLFFGLALAFGRRAGCHTVCWMAPFMVIGRRIGNLLRLPAFRLTAESSSCSHCRTCTAVCPMSIDVEKLVSAQKMEHPDCTLCAQC